MLIGDEMGHGKALHAWPCVSGGTVSVEVDPSCPRIVSNGLISRWMLDAHRILASVVEHAPFDEALARRRSSEKVSWCPDRGEAPSVLGCPSWKRMSSSMRRWLEDNRR